MTPTLRALILARDAAWQHLRYRLITDTSPEADTAQRTWQAAQHAVEMHPVAKATSRLAENNYRIDDLDAVVRVVGEETTDIQTSDSQEQIFEVHHYE